MIFSCLLIEAYQRQRNMRKSKSDVIKKRMELAKREHVDKFAKIAAPSGLLNGLNLEIINHVRKKKKHVHSSMEYSPKNLKMASWEANKHLI